VTTNFPAPRLPLCSQRPAALPVAAVIRFKGSPFVLAVRQKYTTEPRLGVPDICYVTSRNNELRR
jgi:hypothetical protein